MAERRCEQAQGDPLFESDRLIGHGSEEHLMTHAGGSGRGSVQDEKSHGG